MNEASLALESGGSAEDDHAFTQGGFRLDADVTPADLLTVQGDIYAGRFGQLNANDVEVDGGNLMTRWTRQLGDGASAMVQAYYDRTHRLIPGVFEEERNTVDVEWQHGFPLNDRHRLVWGLNYRGSSDHIGNIGPTLAFHPDSELVHLAGVYVQDEWQIVPERFSVIAGTKLEYNSFSGFEVQPSGRFAWNLSKGQMIWGAVSRAVRTPTRIDQDLFAPNPSSGRAALLVSDRGFESEELLAYEVGYRVEPARNVAIDLALFYNDYDRLRSLEAPPGQPLRIANGLEGSAYGAEIDVKWRATNWWRFDVGYTVMATHLRPAPGSLAPSGRSEGNDPNHILVARSAMDLPGDFELDVICRYMDARPFPATPGYVDLDMRLGWSPQEHLELAVVGRNLLDSQRPEYRGTTITREVRRSIYGIVTWRF